MIARLLTWRLALLLGLLCAAVLVFLLVDPFGSRTLRPGPFYAIPSPLPPGPPGTIIREQPLHDFYESTTAYRVLYKSTSYDGKPTAVSGLIVVPNGPPPKGGRKVVAFTHGTVGVASGCAPSLLGNRAVQVIEGLGEFLAAGYVVAATDYQGLGTAGPHPYLVGRAEAIDALDSVRAARRLPQAHAGDDFAVWGHSQGGQASLFTGQLATSYAPDLHLVGVAAGAPVPDLIDLFKVNEKTLIGKVLIAMALSSWSRVYASRGARLDQVVKKLARPAVEGVARTCLYGNEIVGAVPSAFVLSLSFISHPPWKTQPWKSIAEQNSPGRTPIAAPILITQGTADKIVPPGVTEALANRLCASGERVDVHLYPSVEHVEAGILAAPDVATWIARRFAGQEAPSTC